VTTLSRRGFLARTATATLAAGGLTSLLAACDVNAVNANLLNPTPPPGPYNPVTWPIRTTNRPITSGLLPESDATLRIYAWPGRIGQRCVREFRKKYGCQVNVSTFSSMSEAIATVTSRRTRFDVVLGVTIDVLGSFINGGLIQPLNHSYIPNIGQVWTQFTDPFYDLHWRYTAPYMIYTTGIGWRKDLVRADPFAMVNGWDVLWSASYDGKVAVLDGYRAGIGLGLLKNSITDLNTADPLLIDGAGRALSQLAAAARPELAVDPASSLGTGRVVIAQALSGHVAAAARYLPASTPMDVLGYWFPPSGSGPVANDTMVVPRDASFPILAHLFINFMLNQPNAIANVHDTGFMQPLTWMTPERLVRQGVLPHALISTAVLENYFYRGLKELQLSVAANALWQQVWQTVVARMN
jgi:spermidine/putrescine transport system substrate-binding protein